MDLKIESLSKSFGNQKAVDNISFEVRSGEIVGFLGPNGAGKTTTMKMLTQYISPDHGTIWYGSSSSRDAIELRRSIGYLPEHNPLYEDMPMLDYLAFCAALQGVPQGEIQNNIRSMVKKCGLDVEKHKKIGELSKGFRQRVGLAQAIIHNPKILILDEATSSIDSANEELIQDAIKLLLSNRTSIVIAHRLSTIQYAHEILVMHQGEIIERGNHNELLEIDEGVYKKLTKMQQIA